MKFKGGNTHKRVGLSVGVLALALCLLVPGPRGEALAGGGETAVAIAAPIAGVIGVTAIAYGMWINRPGQTGERYRLPGEMYVGGFLGASFVQSTSWNFTEIPGGPVTAGNVQYQPAVVGGGKLGYFCNRYPWFGVEGETNFTRNDVREQIVSLSRGLPQGKMMNQTLNVWTSSLKLMARYGFFPDQDVPFGRLQPYVGIGPGFVVVYADADSAKNFSLELQAGVRYMMLKNVSAFVEYKFSKQWNVELESQQILAPVSGQVVLGTSLAKMDFDAHKVVAGVAYHF